MAAKVGETSYRMSNEHRDKIKNSNILNALIAHAEGNREMTATQVQAGLGLLRKVLPDLAAMQVTGENDGPIRFEIAWSNVGGSSSTTVPDDNLQPSTTEPNAGQ